MPFAEHIATYCPGEDRERFLFLTRNGTHPLRSDFARNTLGPALRRAGLADRRITWLSLRHTAASLMFDAGEPHLRRPATPRPSFAGDDR